MPLNCFPKPNILPEIHSSSISQQYLVSVLFSRTKISKQPQNHILLLSHQYFAYSHRVKLYHKSQHNTLTSNKGLHSPEGHVSYLPLTLCTKLHNFLILWNNMPSSSPLCQFHNCFSLCLKLHPQTYHLFITNVSRNNQFFMVDSSIYVQLFATPRTAAHQVSLSMGFPRKEYWSGQPFPSPADLPNAGIKSRVLHSRKIL